MDTKNVPYLLRRIRFHRYMARTTECNEAWCAHHQFVRHYQSRLLAIRRARAPEIRTPRHL